MEVKGKIKLIGDVQTFDSGTTKRSVVITQPGDYGKDVSIDFFKEKADLIDNFNVDDDVEVSINIQSREYNGKWYTNINGWKIFKQNQEGVKAEEPTTQGAEIEDGGNELPF